MSDTRHQCRWCSELVTGNGIYCHAKQKALSERATKRVNRCRDFDFNEIDAYDLGNIYRERVRHKKQVDGQMCFAEMIM